jgi:anthranilate synthase component 2
MKLLLIDNYDSFTYNLVHLIEKVSNLEFDVIRNDKITLEEVGQYDKIMISPGPGLPIDSGISLSVIQHYGASKSILGVCLGLQAIAEAYGGSLINLDSVYHGIATPINLGEKDSIFAHCPPTFDVGRYHSWVVDSASLPHELLITALDAEGQIMALKHRTHDVRGVQFHPESFLSEHGETIISNWLKL